MPPDTATRSKSSCENESKLTKARVAGFDRIDRREHGRIQRTTNETGIRVGAPTDTDNDGFAPSIDAVSSENLAKIIVRCAADASRYADFLSFEIPNLMKIASGVQIPERSLETCKDDARWKTGQYGGERTSTRGNKIDIAADQCLIGHGVSHLNKLHLKAFLLVVIFFLCDLKSRNRELPGNRYSDLPHTCQAKIPRGRS